MCAPRAERVLTGSLMNDISVGRQVSHERGREREGRLWFWYVKKAEETDLTFPFYILNSTFPLSQKYR